jgi:hypothetical protein
MDSAFLLDAESEARVAPASWKPDAPTMRVAATHLEPEDSA